MAHSTTLLVRAAGTVLSFQNLIAYRARALSVVLQVLIQLVQLLFLLRGKTIRLRSEQLPSQFV